MISTRVHRLRPVRPLGPIITPITDLGAIMLYAIYFAAFLALTAVAAFVWTAVRTAVGQIIDNRRRDAHEADLAAFWTSDTDDDPDAPVQIWPTYTTPLPVDQAARRAQADEIRNDLRRKCY